MDLSRFRVPFRDDSIFGWLFFLCLTVPLIFDISTYEAYDTIKFGLLMLGVGGSFAAIFVSRKYLQENLFFRLNKTIVFIVLGFVFWALLASIFALDKNYAFFGFYPRFSNGFIFFCIISLAFLITGFVNFEKIRFLIKVLFFCSGLVAIWGILQSLGIGYYGGLSLSLFSRAAPSFLGNVNFSSMFVATMLPIGLLFFLESVKKSTKYYFGVSVLFQIFSLIVFSSRGALLGLFVGLGVSIFTAILFGKIYSKKTTALYIGVLVLLLGFGLIFFNSIRPGSLAQTLTFREANLQDRLAVWKMSLKYFEQHPLLGSGLGNFEIVFEQNRHLAGIKIGFFDDPHNLFIHLLVTGGLPLLLLFLGILLYPMYLGAKNLNQNISESAFISSLLGAVSAWAVTAMFTPVTVPCFLLLVVLLSGFFVKEQQVPLAKFKLFKPFGATLSVIVIVMALCFIISEHLFFAGLKSYNAGDYKKTAALTKAAIYLDPFNNLFYQYEAGSLIREGKFAEAEKALNKFASFHKIRAYTYIQLANLNYLQLYQTQDSKYIPSVLGNVKKAISLDPEASGNYFTLAQYYLVLGQLDQSIAATKQGLELEKTLSAWMFLAKVYQYKNDRNAVIETINQALKDNRDNDSLQTLLHLAQNTADIRKLPFNVQLNIGTLD